MAEQKNQPDRELERVSRDQERRHKDAIEAMARKNAEVQREAQKARQASEQRKIAMRRQLDD
jgi:hypothetical protein